jgi:hypothetical protein
MLEHLRAGIVQAVAETTVAESTRSVRGNFLPIPPKDWKEISAYDSVWKTGHLTYGFIDDYSAFRSKGTMRHFNVRFEPKSVHAIIKDVTPRPPKPIRIRPGIQAPGSHVAALVEAPAVNKGGRPPKAWWHSFWVEMCCRVFDGDIQPTTTQAAILEQMQQWVSDQGHDAGDTVLKEAAQRLSRALKARSET